MFGPYEVVPDWPKDISKVPGHEGWTWGAGQSIYAESPDRIFALQRGELPTIEEPDRRPIFDFGPSLYFPVGHLPLRDTTVSSMPSGGAGGQPAEGGMERWQQAGGRPGIDARWEHCIVVLDGDGNVIETWSQWDSMLQRPHFITMNPYDPDKHVWVIDDHKHVIHKFTNDGKDLVQTIGTYGEPGDDESHFNRPTFVDWLPDGTFFVADGYNNHRVVKFDKDGNYLLDWGEEGNPPDDDRPGYFTNVHGIAVDPETRRVFVNDRYNHRVQIFDENGEFLDQWWFGDPPSIIYVFHIMSDGYLWAADTGTNKILKYDLDGNFLYSWGCWGDFPGGFWGVHGINVDQEGNLYVSEVNSGGFQKFRPRKGANPDYLIGQPIRAAW
jgi:DNA-binding beta-propeller fold protein YncE